MGILDRLGQIAGDVGEGILQQAEDFAKALKEPPTQTEEQVTDIPTDEPDALFWDPYALIEQLGFKDKPSAITYGTLRTMSWKIPLVQAILQTRLNQLVNFARPQVDMYSVGFQIGMVDREATPSAADKKHMSKMEEMFLTTGVSQNPLGREALPTFLRKVGRDALELDQMCHPAGTRIETDIGFVPIEAIEVGDRVWTHKGRFRRVTELKHREYTGSLYTVRVRGQEISATEGHPLLVQTNKWFNLTPQRSKGRVEWLEIRDIQKGHYLMYPKPRLPEEPHQEFLGQVLDEDFAYLLGYYVADGCRTNRQLAFTYGEAKDEIGDFLIAWANQRGFAHNLHVYEDRNAKCLFINRCGDLAFEFDKVCGRGSSNKKVPKAIFQATRAIRRAFLAGYFFGDGCPRPNKMAFCTVSQELFTGLRTLLASEGMYAALVDAPECGVPGSGWSHRYDGQVSGQIYRDFAAEHGFWVDHSVQVREPVIQDDEYFYLKVTSVRSEGVEEQLVFNFEVEEDESYLAEGIVSHNCFEIVKNKKGLPAQFYAVDGATIRIADTPKTWFDENDRYRVKTVQLYDNIVINEWDHESLAFCVRNPKTDIRNYGYGTSEAEMLVAALTSYLWGFQYNCIDGDSLVQTEWGNRPLRELPGEDFKIWNGRQFSKARAVYTGVKPLVRTKLWNGLELRSSPDHRLLVVRADSDGDPEWVRQHELCGSDSILVNTAPVDSPIPTDRLQVGRTYLSDRKTGSSFEVTPELVEDPKVWEMLGFALGDGYWPSPDTRGAPLQIFPNYTKDADVRDQFLATCQEHKIQVDVVSKVASTGAPLAYLHIHHKAFWQWLWDIGFSGSSQGKVVPELVQQLPLALRCAFLRGLFSADGTTSTHVTGYRTPSVHATNPVLRQGILQLLWSVGVEANEVGSGWVREGQLRIQNVHAFAEHVSFLQAYKARDLVRSDKAQHRFDKLSKATTQQVCGLLRESSGWLDLPLKDRALVSSAQGGHTVISRPRAIAMLESAGTEVPWFLAYTQCPVDVCDEEPVGQTPMFDIEVQDDEHIFLAGNMAVHNSKFFSQGSVAKGLLNIKGPINQKQLNNFRRAWHLMVSGIENSFRTPILNSDDIQWINMQQSNRDMEFAQWMDFLIKVISSVYQIDPMEAGFKYGDAGGGKSLFESGNKQKLAESKDKGLKPFLEFIARQFTNYIVKPIDPAFEFRFVGLEAQTKDDLAKLNAQRVKTTHTINELRAEQDLDPDPFGDVILDPTYVQYRQGKEMGEQGMGEEGEDDDPGFGEDDFKGEDDEDENDDFGEDDFKGTDDDAPAKPAGPPEPVKKSEPWVMEMIL